MANTEFVNHAQSAIFNFTNMPFNAIRDKKFSRKFPNLQYLHYVY